MCVEVLMMKNSIIFYRSFYEAIKNLSFEEQGKAYNAIMQYAFDDTESDVDGGARLIYIMAKPQIDANNMRKINGAKGGRPKKNHEEKPMVIEESETEKPMVISEEEVLKPNEELVINNDNVNVNDNDIKTVISAWNEITSVPAVKNIKSSSLRYKMLKARLRDNGLQPVLDAIEKVKHSDFLQGQNGGWQITFDWFVKPNNFIKVLEGNYDNKPSDAGKKKSGGWNNRAGSTDDYMSRNKDVFDLFS